MKYIIPQSRLKKLIFKYLDMQDFNMVEKNNAIFLSENVGDEYGFLKYKYNTGTLFILKGFADKISNIFGIPVKNAEEIISLWVENAFDVGVTKTKVENQRYHFFLL